MKKIASILLIITLIFSVSGCSHEENLETEKNNQVSEINNNIKKEESPKIKEIQKGETITLNDYCEFTINDINFGKTISPSNPKGLYTFYESKDEKEILLDSVIEVKSLLSEEKMAEEFLEVKVLHNNKYEYGVNSSIEYDDGSDFTYTNITPIGPSSNGMLHFIALVPKNVENDNKLLVIMIKANNEEFKYNIRQSSMENW